MKLINNFALTHSLLLFLFFSNLMTFFLLIQRFLRFCAFMYRGKNLQKIRSFVRQSNNALFCFISQCFCVVMWLWALFLSSTINAWTRLLFSQELKPAYFRNVPKLRTYLSLTFSHKELSRSINRFQRTSILTYSNQVSIFIYPPNPHNFHFLIPVRYLFFILNIKIPIRRKSPLNYYTLYN